MVVEDRPRFALVDRLEELEFGHVELHFSGILQGLLDFRVGAFKILVQRVVKGIRGAVPVQNPPLHSLRYSGFKNIFKD